MKPKYIIIGTGVALAGVAFWYYCNNSVQPLGPASDQTVKPNTLANLNLKATNANTGIYVPVIAPTKSVAPTPPVVNTSLTKSSPLITSKASMLLKSTPNLNGFDSKFLLS